MKIAVFGGSGFLGSYLVNELLERGHKVISADISPCIYVDSEHYIEASILDKKALNKMFEAEKFDAVYNLAGFASLDKAINYPYETFELNVLGNINLLEASRKHEVKHFVYASSAYAMNNKGSFYGVSKLSSEKVVEEYKSRYELDYTILRYGSVYSERSYENNYIFNLIKTAVKSNQINHSGDGNEIREYIHAVDAAKLSADVIENKVFLNKHLMLTGVERMHRKDLFSIINEILGNSLEININNDGYTNHYRYTPYSFFPNNCEKITPNPYIDMGQGILNCIKEITKQEKNG